MTRYLKKKVERKDIQKVLGIKKTRFFALIKQLKEDPENFSISYFRSTPTRAISKAIEANIIKELNIEKDLIKAKEEVSTYKGIDIVSIILPENADLEPLNTISYAFLGNNLVIGGNLSPVKKAIEVFQGERNSLLKNSEYKELKIKTGEKVEPSSFFFCLFSNV